MIRVSPYGEIDRDLEYWKEHYLKHLYIENASKNTIKLYERVMNELIEFAFLEKVNSNISSLKEANKYFIQAFVYYLKERNVSDSTIFTYLKAIKSFFKFISGENEEGIDLYYRIEKIKIKVKKKEPKRYIHPEIERITANFKNEISISNNFSKVRNRLIVLFLIYTGMRISECLSIKIGSLKEEESLISFIVRGKGNKERVLFIKKELIDKELRSYLKLKEKKAIFSEFLFCDKNGKELKYNTVYKANKQMLQSLGINNKGLHAYRHYFAVRAIEKGINLQTLSEWLGHSSIQITSEFYAKASIKAKKDLAKNIY